MNSRKTLFLTVLVLIVGGIVFWDHQKGQTTDDTTIRSKRLIDIDAKAVTELELIRADQKTIEIVRVGDNWEIKRPVLARANFSTVSELLDTFEFAEHTRTLTEHDMQSATLRDFGLDPARETVKLTAQSEPIIVRIGSDTPTHDALYVQVEGRKQVYVVAKTLFEQANQSLDALRDRTAFDFIPAAVTRLEITSGGGRSIELTKSTASTNAEPRWIISRPLVARADQVKVNDLLTELSGLRVQDFVSDDPKEVGLYRLNEAERAVTVFTGDAGKTLLLGPSPTNDPTKVYAKLKTTDSIFTVPAGSLKKLAAQINDLRDSRVLVFNTNEVKAIEIAHGIDKISLKRDDKEWALTTPLNVPASDDSVAVVLRILSSLRAREFAADVATDLDQYGLAVPAAMVTLRGEGTNLIAQLLVGSVNATNGMRFVKRADEPFIYAAATNAIDQLPASYGRLRSRVVFDLNPDQITQLTSGDVTIGRGDQGKWQLVAPAQGVLDIDAVQALLGAFAKLEAQSYGRPKAEADATLGYTIKAASGGVTNWVSIAADGEAAANSVELTFKLAPSTIETLTNRLVTTPKVEVTPPAAETNAPTGLKP